MYRIEELHCKKPRSDFTGAPGPSTVVQAHKTPVNQGLMSWETEIFTILYGLRKCWIQYLTIYEVFNNTSNSFFILR